MTRPCGYPQDWLALEHSAENGDVIDITEDIIALLPELGYSDEPILGDLAVVNFRKAWHVSKSGIIVVESLPSFAEMFSAFLKHKAEKQKANN